MIYCGPLCKTMNLLTCHLFYRNFHLSVTFVVVDFYEALFFVYLFVYLISLIYPSPLYI